MSKLTAAGLQGVAAMNARVYDMTPADRDQWYRDHPVSDYEEALECFSGEDEDGANG